MTREEAINMLKAKISCLNGITSGVDAMCNNGCCVDCSLNYEQGTMGEQKEALKIAIQALEQIPDLKEAYNRGYKDGQEAHAVHLELCEEEQEPCEDCPNCGADMRGIE